MIKKVLFDKYFMSMITLLLLAVISNNVIWVIPDTRIEKTLEKIPLRINGYVGNNNKIEEPYEVELNADDYIFREYIRNKKPKKSKLNRNGSQNKAQQFIWLYIGYWGTRKGGRTGHHPFACYPSAGYTILKEDCL